MKNRTYSVGVVLVLFAVLLGGCATGEQQAAVPPVAEQPAPEPPAPEPPAVEMAPEAKAHLDELLELMEKHSINRQKIDWAALRAKVYSMAAGAKTVTDTRPAIGEALRLLDDKHSAYMPKGGGRLSFARCTSEPGRLGPPVSPEVPPSVGYIRVFGFSGTVTQATEFAGSILQAIKDADRQGVTGWLVDLRLNTGGNMWPMLMGLSPLLGEGPAGYLINSYGEKMGWKLQDGVVYIGEKPIDPNQATYRLQNPPQRVAVLTGPHTTSSGEAVAITFRGLANTRSFGTPTCGLSTGNGNFPLSDGGMLVLTSSVMADRTGKPYGGPVIPDEVVEDPDELAQRVIEWLTTGN
ncbi:MAG TPA: S41 family peptidase [Symbiobacteriaceae bacterium]|nr:S41 family peptidase [Symbiobacteriaceae bacterium]